MREVRVEEHGQAFVALRHGQVLGRVFGRRFERRLGLRRLFIIVLCGLQMIASRPQGGWNTTLTNPRCDEKQCPGSGVEPQVPEKVAFSC